MPAKNPQPSLQHSFNQALTHFRAGQHALAIPLCRKVLAQRPNHADAAHLLGLSLAATGKLDQAAAALTQAVRINPADITARNNLGNALMSLNRLDDAIAQFRHVLSLNPTDGPAAYNLGLALCNSRQWEKAVSACRFAAALLPTSVDAQVNLAAALREQFQWDESIAACQRALALKPDSAAAFNNLGSALVGLDRIDDAIAAWHQALKIEPSSAEAYNNLASVHLAAGQPAQTIAECRQALALRPDFPAAHWNLSLALLVQGDLAAGWPEYEFRWRIPGAHDPMPEFRQPQWTGQPFTDSNRRILLHPEQGLGDAIMFSRYVPLLAERGAKIFLLCHTPLHRLFSAQRWPNIESILGDGDKFPAFDVHCPLLSLPLAFATTLQTIPNSVPYLRADPALTENWRSRLANVPNRKIGIAWAGNPTHLNDRHRSLPPATLHPLAAVPNVSWSSLQKPQPKSLPDLPMLDWMSEAKDLADTAALIANLDLVISADTAIAHLSAALGKPTWILLPHTPDWRWLERRPDSPWYPTARLFRQPSRGDWPSVISAVTESLANPFQLK